MRKLGSDGKEQHSANFYKAPYVTTAQFAALTPVDGDECYLIADATAGVIWHFRYNAGSSSAYKWESVGSQSPLMANVQGGDTTTTTFSTFADTSPTAGPSITVPRAGDYIAIFSANGVNSVANSGAISTVKPGASAELDAFLAVHVSSTAAATGVLAKETWMLGLAASAIIKMRYCALTSGTATFDRRVLTVRPIRIS